MKKTYKNPTLTVEKIQPTNLLQAISGALDRSRSIESTEGFGARGSRFSDWDDDFDE